MHFVLGTFTYSIGRNFFAVHHEFARWDAYHLKGIDALLKFLTLLIQLLDLVVYDLQGAGKIICPILYVGDQGPECPLMTFHFSQAGNYVQKFFAVIQDNLCPQQGKDQDNYNNLPTIQSKTPLS